MFTSPKVSLIVPTYNQAKYLGACLDSIYFQDYDNLEIIVVNDYSTDETRGVLDSFVQSVSDEQVSYASNFNERTNEIERTYHFRYPQKGRELIVLHNEENMGSTRTYNRGFQEASGKYCTYIASDDFCHCNMISSMVDVLEREDVDFVYSQAFLIDDAGRILRKLEYGDYSFEACFANWYLMGVSKLYKLELHRKYGFYNNDFLANDHECYQRFALEGVKFRYIPKVLYSIRAHLRDRQVGVHSNANWEKLLNESKGLVKEARKHLGKA